MAEPPELPAIGTRVSLRYRLPAGSVPPLTDVVGHLVEVGPTLRVRDKRGDVTAVEVADVVAVKALGAAPVRTVDIRHLEHAAAHAWPGVEQKSLGGWLLRFGHGSTRRANSAVPLDVSPGPVPSGIVDWYATRGAPTLLAAPDRLFRAPPGAPVDGENVVMTRGLRDEVDAPDVDVTAAPGDDWLRLHPRKVPVDVLTAVLDGELGFAVLAEAAVARVAITAAPDGTRWAGLSSVYVAERSRRRGLGRALCAALLGWAGEHGATRAYVQVEVDNATARSVYESMGFVEHHRSRYLSLG